MLFLMAFALLPPPCESLEAIWSAPSFTCLRRNATQPLAKWGIRANAEQTLFGEELVLFYERDLGLYPHYSRAKGKWIHGGIPQRSNFTAHLEKARRDIDFRVPNVNFSGVGIIDWEAWRPHWDMNYGGLKIYRQESVREARELFPDVSAKAVDAIARGRFNKYARKLMMATIQLAKDMRPSGRWGYYGFPMCFHQNLGTRECQFEDGELYNANWAWVFDVSTALFPSIYLSKTALRGKWSSERRLLYARIPVRSALGWAGAARPDHPPPVYAFIRYNYGSYSEASEPYTKSDLCASIKQLSDMGAAGVLLWSSFFSASNVQRCRRLFDSVTNEVGPMIKLTQERAAQCAKERCAEGQRCVLPDPLPDTCSLATPYSAYRCGPKTHAPDGPTQPRRAPAASNNAAKLPLGHRTQ